MSSLASGFWIHIMRVTNIIEDIGMEK